MLRTYVLSVDEAVDAGDGTVTVTLPEVLPSTGIPDPVVTALLCKYVGCATLRDGRPYNTTHQLAGFLLRLNAPVKRYSPVRKKNRYHWVH